MTYNRSQILRIGLKMKKTELENCPQWLLDAPTFNEDVHLDKYGTVVWSGGQFLGGEFLGGQFLGGQFRGGQFLGGEFLGGKFLGGEFRGGQFRGGQFLGGEFLGGEFRGGQFLGGQFRGEKITKAPIFVFNIGYWSASITTTKMALGCQVHTFDKWRNFTDEDIAKMDEGALSFWNRNKVMLLSLCDFNSRS